MYVDWSASVFLQMMFPKKTKAIAKKRPTSSGGNAYFLLPLVGIRFFIRLVVAQHDTRFACRIIDDGPGPFDYALLEQVVLENIVG
ncbi:hypothetical protein [Solidesulfovibrio fructosivorans]|uniref:hypothetical protein n=1 Tax=Solidesulfovibrio fructosivorans TaxID=878 RepID=UPI00117CB5AB|nr:hypothetical protein [Solidesulfovibrio fructosivorans]